MSEHPRDNVIYYYTAVNLLNAYAWVGFVPGMLWNLLRKQGHWVKPAAKEGFLLIWMVTIFVFFQCMATKYITYTYPLLLPLCLLTGSYIVKKGRSLTMKWMLLGNVLFTEPCPWPPISCPSWLQAWCRAAGTYFLHADLLCLHGGAGRS